MDACPACGSHRVFRSKTRTTFERLRRELTSKRPYRCHACTWRGWAPDAMLVTSPHVMVPEAAGDVTDTLAPPPDLAAIDAALGGAPKEPREKQHAAPLFDTRSVEP